MEVYISQTIPSDHIKWFHSKSLVQNHLNVWRWVESGFVVIDFVTKEIRWRKCRGRREEGQKWGNESDGNRKEKSQMKRLRKGRENVISHRDVEGERRTETDRIKRGEGRRGLTVAGSCTVSVLLGNYLCPLAAEPQPSPNGVRLASPSRCPPVTYIFFN